MGSLAARRHVVKTPSRSAEAQQLRYPAGGPRFFLSVRGAALELSFRMRQDQKGWEADEGCGIFKVEVVPITEGTEPELFWEYLEDDVVAVNLYYNAINNIFSSCFVIR